MKTYEVQRGRPNQNYLLNYYTELLESEGYFVSAKVETKGDHQFYTLRGTKGDGGSGCIDGGTRV